MVKNSTTTYMKNEKPTNPDSQKSKQADFDAFSTLTKIRGSLTQWMINHSDSLVGDTGKELARYCDTCGLRVPSESPGSLTQWIFKSHMCKCQKQDLHTESHLKETETEIDVHSINSTPDKLEVSEISDIPEEFPIERFSPVELLSETASGPMYAAIDRILKKKVIVKLITLESQEHLASLKSIFRNLSRLEHPNIAKILDYSLDNNSPYLVIEFVDGTTLDSLLRNQGPMQELDAIDVFIPVVEALKYAHQYEVFHKNLKPDNIFLKQVGDEVEVIVVDFGFAYLQELQTKLEREESLANQMYSSPEVINGQEFDQQSDLYSLGTVLFETISGKLPFQAVTESELISEKLNSKDLSVEKLIGADKISKQLSKLIEYSLSTNKKERVQTASEFAETLLGIKSILYSSEHSSDNYPGQKMGEDTSPPISQSTGFNFTALTASVIAIGVLIVCGFSFVRLFEKPKASVKLSDSELLSGFSLSVKKNFVEFPYEDITVQVHLNPMKKRGVPINELADLKTINGFVTRDSVVSKRQLKYLENKGLKLLFLRNCILNDSALEQIGNFSDLEQLNLSGVNLQDRSIDFLLKLKKLKVLRLEYCRIDANKLPILVKLENLEDLRLNDINYGDEVIGIIMKMNNLKHLTIARGDYSAKELLKLKKLKHLTTINAWGASSLSKDARKRLASQFKGIELQFNKERPEDFGNLSEGRNIWKLNDSE